MSPPVSRAALRRFCQDCGYATRSWIDAWHTERCSVHDPEDGDNPGHGIYDDYDEEVWGFIEEDL